MEVEPLGAGGMASVTLARDTVLGRLVALKRVRGVGSPRELARLRREALVGASLNHRNLVAVYDVEEDEGSLVIVMEYVRGTTLRERLASQGMPGNEETIRILEGVAQGLDALHARGIVHRDVKPANILLGEDGAVKLADLGIASVPDRTQSTAGAMFGTFSYMAPEQLEGGRATPASDIYALGALAFELLCGEKARPESNPLALAHAMATQPPPDLRKRAPRTPARVAALLQGAMSTSAQERPRSAGQLVGRLREALVPATTAKVLPRGAAPPRRSRSRGSRRARVLAPLLVGLVALAALLIALDSGSSPSSTRTSSEETSRSAGVKHRSAAKGSAASGSSGAGSATSAGGASPAASTTGSGAGAAAGRPTGSTHAASGPAGPAEDRQSAGPGGDEAKGKGPGPAAGGPHGKGPAGAGPPGRESVGAGPSAGAGSPAGAVEAFYGAAARHEYAAAWGLADARMRAEVAGYGSFAAQQSAVRSITFHRAQTLPGASPSQATVAVITTSVLSDRTEQCSGTVRMVRAAASWLLDGISIDCTP